MIGEAELKGKIESFKRELVTLTSSEMVQKRIIFGDCEILDNGVYFSLRSKIATHFSVHPNEVLVVGSAKLGFSVAPLKRYKLFGESSDIDVVIVSQKLFNSFWKAVYYLWKEKVLWEGEREFKKYLFQGWIRPDKLPSSRSVSLKDEWWEFYRALTSSGDFGPYKINGAIYQDWEFLEGYQDFAVQICKDKL